MNPLDNYPAARRVLYLVQWITTGLTGIIGLYFTSGGNTPEWYVTLVALLAFAWTYTGFTAQQNVTGGGGDEMFGNPLERDEKGVIRYDGAGGVILLVLAVVGIVLLVLLLAGGVRV